ncbi:MAG: hypothetical protein ISR65_10500 [Bacteriovoracaceae bacterium]|nr:hypothetical protein [Bacteriovoracaceae bacterium]
MSTIINYKIYISIALLGYSFASFCFTCKSPPLSKKECGAYVKSMKQSILEAPVEIEKLSQNILLAVKSRPSLPSRIVQITCGCIDKNDRYASTALEFLTLQIKLVKLKYQNINTILQFSVETLNTRYAQLASARKHVKNKQTFNNQVADLTQASYTALRGTGNYISAMVTAGVMSERALEFALHLESKKTMQIWNKHGFESEQEFREYYIFLLDFITKVENAKDNDDLITRPFRKQIQGLIGSIEKLYM